MPDGTTVREMYTLIKQGIASGWQRPVVLALSLGSAHAHAVHEALLGKPMPELPADADPDDELGVQLFVRCERVAEVVREHCGPGGTFVARHLMDEVSSVDGWFLALRRDGMCYCGFAHGGVMCKGYHGYETVGRHEQTLGEELQDDGPSRLNIETDEGNQVMIFGRTGLDAAVAGALVSALLSGNLTGKYQGRMRTVRCTDDMLVDFLSRAYSDDSGPHQIAEAIRALKKLPGEKEKRLVRLLRNRPGLAELNQKVKFELSGEGNAA
jgi:hypothetical protein